MQLSAIPKRRSYPALGVLLAVAAPGGLLIIRAFGLGEDPTGPWVAAELSSRALTYGYVAVSTAIVFVGLGRVLGSHEDELQRLSITDPLTGLPNRRHFEQRLGEELARVVRYDHLFVLMLLDLDELKKVNDTSGHDAGDEALRATARTLRRACRATDEAFRTGGDEFAVLAPNVTRGEAERLAERIREALALETNRVATSFPSLSLSVGVADTRCIREPQPDQLYAAADQALYQAKQAGKDRVMLAPPVDQGRAGRDDNMPGIAVGDFRGRGG